jgi:hypothetical protein
MCSACFYIKAKGRSGWWILMLVFSLVGILVLALLKDRAAGDQSEAVQVPVGFHRKEAGNAVLDKLNGWQAANTASVIISGAMPVAAVDTEEAGEVVPAAA